MEDFRMNKIIFMTLFAFCVSAIFAAEAEDSELLSDKVVNYFRKVSLETGRPVSIKITLTEAFTERDSIEDEKELLSDALPTLISKRYIVGISAVLQELLPDFSIGKDPERLVLNVTMWVNAPGHKEKVNGFCSLKARK